MRLSTENILENCLEKRAHYSLNVFNSAIMNDAVLKFKRYEDASLAYTGISKHDGLYVGLYNTKISREEYETAFFNEPVVEYE